MEFSRWALVTKVSFYREGVGMAAPYSMDLRRKIIAACDRGDSTQGEVAQFIDVSISFVEKLLRIYRITGEFAALRNAAGRHTPINSGAREKLMHSLA